MTKPLQRNILLTPGPATTTDSVKQALVVPDVCPREKEFSEVLLGVLRDLLKVAGCDEQYVVVPFAGSGTAVMDATINTVVAPDGKLAVVDNGAYGRRMVEIAEAYGIPCLELTFPWGTRPDLKAVGRALAENPDVTCLAVVHHETTTGMLNPLAELGALAAQHDCTFVVDAVSSLGGLPFDVEACQIDFLFSTANKCLQGMPGLSFVIARRAALAQTESYPARSYYLNLYKQNAFLEKTGQMPFTVPVQVVYALRQALDELSAEGLSNRHRRYQRNADTLKDGLRDAGLRLLLKDEDESGLLLTVIEPDDPRYDFTKMHDLLHERGFTIYPGKLDDQRTFRLGTIGAIDASDIEDFLSALKEVLEVMGVVLNA